MAAKAFCTSCGESVEESWRFCEDCGAEQNSVSPSPSSPPVLTPTPAAPRVELLAPPLEARGVEVKVGSKTLLEPTTLKIQKGELVAIIGPSGSGKSTLLKTLGGVRTSSGGTVLMRGQDVGLRQADIGYVPQDDTLHHLLSVHEALSFAG